MRNWKIAFQASLGYAKMKPEDVIESLRNLGYEGIEWTKSHFDPDRPIGELEQLVERTRDAGMEVSRVMAHEDLVSLDDIARKEKIDHTVRIIETAGACGIAMVGVMTGPAPWKHTMRLPKPARKLGWFSPQKGCLGWSHMISTPTGILWSISTPRYAR